MSKQQIGASYRSRIDLLIEVLRKAAEHPEFGLSRIMGYAGVSWGQMKTIIRALEDAKLAQIAQAHGKRHRDLKITEKGLEALRRYDAFFELMRDGQP